MTTGIERGGGGGGGVEEVPLLRQFGSSERVLTPVSFCFDLDVQSCASEAQWITAASEAVVTRKRRENESSNSLVVPRPVNQYGHMGG